jgi:16S rRNA G966 N2-methylase RsmD
MVQGNRDPQRHVTATRTVGWRPGCDCGRAAEIVPAVVLDTFAGSGTALAVAVRHARRAIGIELNPEYIPLIEKRMLAAEMSTGFGFGYSE